jgi:hypothetical protein
MMAGDAAGSGEGSRRASLEMDHDHIEQNHVADRYLMGKLTPEEADRFEEHYLSCPLCLDRLEQAEALHRGFKRAAAEDAVRLAAVRQAGLFALLGRSRQAGIALAALCAVLLLPGLLAWREAGRLGRQLDQANAALARGPSEEPRDTAAARAAQTARDRSEAERRRLESQLAQEREARAGLERRLSQAYQPQTNTPILSLSPERGGADGEPTHRVRLPKVPGWIVLSLDLDRPELDEYRAVLLNAGGEVWRSGGLRPNENDSLVVTLPSTLLKAGDYSLRVDGRDGKGVARFGFRVQAP